MNIFEPIPPKFLEQVIEGVVERAISGHLPGRVTIMGVSWRARLCIPDDRYKLSPGTPVSIIGQQGNTVLVLPYAA